MLWWGRAGKTLEFLGGLTVVIDLLGHARMEVFHAHLRTRRIRLVAVLRRPRTSRRRSGRPSYSSLIRPPGLRVFHYAGGLGVFAGFLARMGWHTVDGSIAKTLVLILSFAVCAPVFGIPLGEGLYFTSLQLLTGLVRAAIRLLGSGRHPATTKLAALVMALRDCRSQLRARWRGEQTPGPQRPPPPPAPDPPGLRVFFIIGASVSALALFAASHYQDAKPGEGTTPLFVVLITCAVGAVLGGLFLGFGGYLAGVLLLEGLVVTTLGQLKTREGLESRLKWIGLVLFAVGFSADLLSS
ncbi:hypothetical protein ACFYXQ_03905 [Nocardia jiangxiensis]|uniref:Cytochrome C biogenesis protein transmembrane region n=1 Tax=Nocardia jiangxiensis TaxID=282685 RepID=A0ABW6RSC7_9NOCA